MKRSLVFLNSTDNMGFLWPCVVALVVKPFDCRLPEGVNASRHAGGAGMAAGRFDYGLYLRARWPFRSRKISGAAQTRQTNLPSPLVPKECMGKCYNQRNKYNCGSYESGIKTGSPAREACQG